MRYIANIIISFLLACILCCCAGDDYYFYIEDKKDDNMSMKDTTAYGKINFVADVAISSISRAETLETEPLPTNCHVEFFVYKSPSTPTSGSTTAWGHYTANSPGYLTPVSGGSISLPSGTYNIYAISTFNTNFDNTPSFKNGIASGLNNGLDYLWWSTKSLVVTAGEEQTVSILFQRKAVCLEFEVSTTSGSTLSKVTQIDFTPPSTSSSTFNLSTGLISQASSLTTGTFLTTISGFEATGYMLPVKTTKQIQLHICVEIDGAISWHSTSLPRPTNNTFLAAHCYEYSLIVDKTSNYIVKSELKGIRALD